MMNADCTLERFATELLLTAIWENAQTLSWLPDAPDGLTEEADTHLFALRVGVLDPSELDSEKEN